MQAQQRPNTTRCIPRYKWRGHLHIIVKTSCDIKPHLPQSTHLAQVKYPLCAEIHAVRASLILPTKPTVDIWHLIFRFKRNHIPPVMCRGMFGASIVHIINKTDRENPAELDHPRSQVKRNHVPPVTCRAMHGAGIVHVLDKAERGYLAALDHVAASEIPYEKKPHTARNVQGNGWHGYLPYSRQGRP